MKNFLYSNGYASTFDPLGVKWFFVLLAFLLVPSAALAQDDDNTQSEGTLLIVPRLDLDPAWNAGDGWSFDLGTTSLYTLFEGNLTRNLSFSISNHWFSYCTGWDDAADLYRNTWRSDATNWVDWINLTYKIGNFFLSAGKDYMRIANFEIEEYDYDSHWQMNSHLWNTFQVYQWGGRLGWQSEDEDLTGWTVLHADGTKAGTVKAHEDIPGNPCLWIDTGHGEVLIPLHEELLLEADPEKQTLRMEIPEGLLDL